jgi:hypothetical protein
MSKHSFAKELMTRPGGVYPKYGAVDRDYAGSEYDGFQDIFTSAIYTNMEWGRLETARLFIDNYFTEYVDARGMVDMRGPETAQFGMTLSLLARYFDYTQDSELMLKHRAKIEATAKLLGDMHDESLKLAQENPSYGLIRGWSESDSCLSENPSLYWQPYYANSAFAARGFKDIARAWMELAHINSAPGMGKVAQGWLRNGPSKASRRTSRATRRHHILDCFPPRRLLFASRLKRKSPARSSGRTVLMRNCFRRTCCRHAWRTR